MAAEHEAGVGVAKPRFDVSDGRKVGFGFGQPDVVAATVCRGTAAPHRRVQGWAQRDHPREYPTSVRPRCIMRCRGMLMHAPVRRGARLLDHHRAALVLRAAAAPVAAIVVAVLLARAGLRLRLGYGLRHRLHLWRLRALNLHLLCGWWCNDDRRRCLRRRRAVHVRRGHASHVIVVITRQHARMDHLWLLAGGIDTWRPSLTRGTGATTPTSRDSRTGRGGSLGRTGATVSGASSRHVLPPGGSARTEGTGSANRGSTRAGAVTTFGAGATTGAAVSTPPRPRTQGTSRPFGVFGGGSAPSVFTGAGGTKTASLRPTVLVVLPNCGGCGG